MPLLLGLDFFTSFLRVIDPQYWGVWSEKERKNKRCVCVNVSLRQKKKDKKNYGNSNISPMQKQNLQKNPI
jgi:hypothetical protein